MPGVWRLRVGTPEPITPTAIRFVPPSHAQMGKLDAPADAPLKEASIQIHEHGLTVRLPYDHDENIYGFGLQMFSFNHRGTEKTLRVNADPVADTGDSHAPVPMYVSSKGYAIFVDTARYATFCCGTAETVDDLADPRTPSPPPPGSDDAAVTSGYVTVRIDGVPGVDIYLFAGPTMLDAVRRYNLYSGGGISPPEWGLGVWYRTERNADDKTVMALAKEFRQKNIPCDVIGLEPGWLSHSYSCSFQWSSRFQSPAAFVKELAALGYKVNLWEHAFVHSSAPFYGEIKPHCGDYLVWQGLTPDFINKEARSIFGQYHRKHLIDLGISGFKLDECDNSDYTGGWSFPEFSRFPSGMTGEQMHSLFGIAYQRTLLEQFEAANIATYCQVRSSGALAAPYPFVLYSDLYDHRGFIRALVNSGFSGLLWCPEVRDCKGPDDLVRRLQSVVFSPLALINCCGVKNPPWKQPDMDKNNAGQFITQWEVLEARCRDVLQWRMMLLPYLRSAFSRYRQDATPPIRALVLDYPDDSLLSSIDDQFMVGDRVMVAPLFDGEAKRQVVLPPGTWHDFWSGDMIKGGRTVDVSSTYERIPVYVKSNVVMPIGARAASTSSPAARRLIVRIFGDGSIPFDIRGQDAPTVRLSWSGSKGTLQQGKNDSPYTVDKWLSSTESWL